jgi:succinoglycan biosynthesis protein ExoA
VTPSGTPPRVSIIVPARNEERSLGNTLDALLAQDIAEPYEIVVAEGNSADATPAILERYVQEHPEAIRVVANPAGGTPQALNVLLAAARGEILVRVDGHSNPPPDYARRLVERIRSGECEAAGGQKRAVGKSAFGRAVSLAHGSKFGIGDSKYHYAKELMYVDHIPFGAYLRERALAIGGWDERLVRNQDFDFDFRYRQAGGRILLDPTISIDWAVRETPKALARQYFQYGFWKYHVLRKHPGSLHVRWLVPPSFVALLAVGVPCALVSEKARWAVGTAAGAYALFLVAATASTRPQQLRVAASVPAAVATMHLSWGAGFLASTIQRAAARARLWASNSS